MNPDSTQLLAVIITKYCQPDIKCKELRKKIRKRLKSVKCYYYHHYDISMKDPGEWTQTMNVTVIFSCIAEGGLDILWLRNIKTVRTAS